MSQPIINEQTTICDAVQLENAFIQTTANSQTSAIPQATIVMLPCSLQSKPNSTNPIGSDSTLLQSGNQFGYPTNDSGLPVEYYPQNPPPPVGFYEGLFKPLYDSNMKEMQLTLTDTSQALNTCLMVSCCPCASCYACCSGGKHSPAGTFCQCCGDGSHSASNASCCSNDCSGPATFIFMVFVLIALAIIVIVVLTAFVSIPIILVAITVYGFYRVFTMKEIKIVLNDEKREITVTKRRKYFKKDEILSESIISYDSIMEIKIKELENKKKYIIAQCSHDQSINFSQYLNMEEKDLDKGAHFLRGYFSLRGVSSLQITQLP